MEKKIFSENSTGILDPDKTSHTYLGFYAGIPYLRYQTLKSCHRLHRMATNFTANSECNRLRPDLTDFTAMSNKVLKMTTDMCNNSQPAHFMLIFSAGSSEGVAMEWLVIDVIYLRKKGGYALILHACALKMIAEVTSEHPVHPGDILYPVMDAMYLINRNGKQRLKVISASVFSAKYWHSLKK